MSAADIAFAVLVCILDTLLHSSLIVTQSYPMLSITHAEGFQEHSMPPSVNSADAIKLREELRATPAGKHVVRLFAEERCVGAAPPRRKVYSFFGLW